MKRVLRFLLLFLISVFVVAGCKSKDPVVAVVGKDKISAADFKSTAIERFRGEDNAMRKSYADRERLVREIAIGKAKVLEAQSRGIDKREEVKSEIDKMARQKALELLYTEKIIDAVITDEAAKKFYDKSGQEVRARHILLKTPPVDSAGTDSVRVKARIDSITSAIKGGLDFKVAALQFSDDATSAADSGNLGWFPWGRMVDAFQDAVWGAEVGRLVGPVRTPYGYHLIIVEEKRPVQDRRPFEEMKAQIKGQLREVESQKLNDMARKFVDKLREDADSEYNNDNVEIFRRKLLDPTVTKSQSLAPVFTDQEKALVVATYKGGKVTVNDLIQKLGTNAARVKWDDANAVTDLTNAIVEPVLLDKAAESSGLMKRALQDKDVRQQSENTMVRLLEKEEVTDKVDPTDQDLLNYYNTHLENYIQPEQRVVREIFVKEDSAKCARIRERALNGENFRDLARRFNEKESTQPDTGRIGPFEEKRFGVIGRYAFALAKVGDVSEVIRSGKSFSVIQLLNIVPSRTKSFEEARAQVARECRQAQTDAAQRALEELVLKKFPLNVKSQALAEVWPLPKEEEKIAREP